MENKTLKVLLELDSNELKRIEERIKDHFIMACFSDNWGATIKERKTNLKALGKSIKVIWQLSHKGVLVQLENEWFFDKDDNILYKDGQPVNIRTEFRTEMTHEHLSYEEIAALCS